MAAPTKNMPPVGSHSERLRRASGGIRGSWLRYSAARNAAVPADPIARASHGLPSDRPTRETATTTLVTVTAKAIVLGRLSVGRRTGATAGTEASSASRIAAMGTLMSSVHRQPNRSTMMPPAMTPIAPPLPAAAAQSPNALARDGPFGKVRESRARPAVLIRAAPAPCTARPAKRIPGLVARPASRLAAAKTHPPAVRTPRAPYRSDSRPANSRRLASGIAKALTAQGSSLARRPRSRRRLASATDRIELSRVTMSCARQQARSVRRAAVIDEITWRA